MDENEYPNKRLLTSLASNGSVIHRSRFFEYPEYFPHVDGCSLRNGFYADLHQLQGYRSTYYAGGLLSFDMVPNAMETSQFIVENYMTG
mmetsp:Transcript_9808/g.18810  ORF Transcript_9808/g.18810 Transcript_9808/m.18810 type:complete len:89 (-) Transcript_9808:285-551(-)